MFSSKLNNIQRLGEQYKNTDSIRNRCVNTVAKSNEDWETKEAMLTGAINLYKEAAIIFLSSEQ